MRLSQFVVSAFANQWWQGNPAAVCLLESWPTERMLQQIAAQNNLSETAFLLAPQISLEHASPIELRWFTPTCEVDLCGHATLATAHVLFHHLGMPLDAQLTFSTRSGALVAYRDEATLAIELPAQVPSRVETNHDFAQCMGGRPPKEVWFNDDYLLVYDSPTEVKSLAPNFELLHKIDGRGVITTALSVDDEETDFVSRFFAPKVGVNEDPVTGSAHSKLVPFWTQRLQKVWVRGWQCSARGGRIIGCHHESSVILKGGAVTFSQATLELPVLMNEEQD